MKKILMLALCAATVSGAFAQKQAVADAKKLSGKIDKIEEARELIQGAMKNVETSNAAETYYVAGNIEWDAYDKARALQMINPEDPAVDPAAMATQLINGYNYFMQALPLDSLPNEKGQVKPKHSKKIHEKIVDHAQDFYTAGANAYNKHMYYPEAYQAFWVCSNIPGEIVDKQTRALSSFYAGLCAYTGKELEKAIEAFRQARQYGYEHDEPNKKDMAYRYEIECWRNLAQNDPSLEATAQNQIYETALEGNEIFGLEYPYYFTTIVNYLATQNKFDEALNLINENINTNPETAILYALRAYVENRKGDTNSAEADYRKAASFEKSDFDTLKFACRFMTNRGREIWSSAEGNSEEDSAKRKNAYENYWEYAKEIGEKACKLNPSDEELNNILDNVDYLLETNKGRF